MKQKFRSHYNFYVIIVVFVCCIFSGTSVVGRNSRSKTGQQHQSVTRYQKRWWEKAAFTQGPNICASEKVIGSPRRFGRPWTGGQICGSPSVVIFSCCEGYSTMPGEPGCAIVKKLTNVYEAISRSGATTLDSLVRKTILMETLSKQGPYTLFAPTNQAFANVTEDIVQAINKTNSRSSGKISLLYYHIIEGRIGEKDFEDDMVVPSLYHRQPLRINKFRNGLVAVNCIPLVQLNQEATNGIIHTIDDILVPSVTHNTLSDIILQEDQFNRLATVLVKAKLTTFLREEKSLTIFAPTNEAFDALTREDYEAIFADPAALTSLLQYHIVADIWCSCSVVSEASLKTLEGNRLGVTCNNSVTYINDAALIKGDIMATNGFIHVIDKVLLPKRAKSLLQILEDLKLKEFLSLIPNSGLQNTFINGAKFTVFAPSNEAIQGLSNDTLEALKSTATATYELLVGHMVTGQYLTSNFADKQTLPTLAQMRPLQVQIYPQKNLIDGGVIQYGNNVGRNGVVHVIDKVLLPPTLTIGQYLQEKMNMSIFVNALNFTKTKLLDQLTNGKGPYTVFAPDDKAFDRLPYFTLDRMLMDVTILTSIMTNHVLDEQLFTSGLLPKVYYQFRTRHGRNFKIREDTGVVTAGIAIIVNKDIFCTNGVLHVVDRVIQL